MTSDRAAVASGATALHCGHRKIIAMTDEPTDRELADRVVSLDKAGKELGYGSEELPWYAKMQIMFYMLDRVRLIK